MFVNRLSISVNFSHLNHLPCDCEIIFSSGLHRPSRTLRSHRANSLTCACVSYLRFVLHIYSAVTFVSDVLSLLTLRRDSAGFILGDLRVVELLSASSRHIVRAIELAQLSYSCCLWVCACRPAIRPTGSDSIGIHAHRAAVPRRQVFKAKPCVTTATRESTCRRCAQRTRCTRWCRRRALRVAFLGRDRGCRSIRFELRRAATALRVVASTWSSSAVSRTTTRENFFFPPRRTCRDGQEEVMAEMRENTSFVGHHARDNRRRTHDWGT